MKRTLSLINPVFLGLSLALAISCSDDNDADKKKELPLLPQLSSPSPSPQAQPRANPNDPSPVPTFNSPESAAFLKSIAGVWLDSCKASDQGSNRFVYEFEGTTWTTYVFKYAAADCTGTPLQADGGARRYKISLKQDQSSWFVASGSCLSDANSCKAEKAAALRLVEGRLETKSLKPGTSFNASEESPTYTYSKGNLSDLGASSTTPTNVAPSPASQPPAALTAAAKSFVKLAQGTWAPQECVKDNRNPEQSLKYIVMFVGNDFKTDIYRYKNPSCEGAPEIKPDGTWTFSYQLSELDADWLALDAVKLGDPSNRTQRLFKVEGNALLQYRLKKTETFEAVRGNLDALKTDRLEKVL